MAVSNAIGSNVFDILLCLGKILFDIIWIVRDWLSLIKNGMKKNES